MKKTPQPSETLTAATPLDSARAKQILARRKMQSLPNHEPRTELPNINWHDHYMKRVGKPTDHNGIFEVSLMLLADDLGIHPPNTREKGRIEKVHYAAETSLSQRMTMEGL